MKNCQRKCTGPKRMLSVIFYERCLNGTDACEVGFQYGWVAVPLVWAWRVAAKRVIS
jgi:hypothetical protein